MERFSVGDEPEISGLGGEGSAEGLLRVLVKHRRAGSRDWTLVVNRAMSKQMS